MTDVVIICVFVGFFVVIGTVVVLVLLFNKRTVIKRNLKKTPAKKISQFLSGDVAKIVGKVEFIGEPLISPLSNRPCAYYHIYVEQHQGSGKNSSWRKLIEEEIVGKFVVRDGNDCAIIDCNEIKTYLVQDQNFQSGFLKDATLGLEKYLDKHGHTSVNMIGLNKSIRYKEGVLESGELIAVAGKGEWKDAKDFQLPESYGRVLEITRTPEKPVYLSDDPSTLKVETANQTYTTR